MVDLYTKKKHNKTTTTLSSFNDRENNLTSNETKLISASFQTNKPKTKMISKSTLRLLPTICVIFIATIAKNDVEAFAPATMIPIQSSSSSSSSLLLLSKNGPTSQLSMIDNSLLDIVSSTSTSSMMLSETEAWVQPLANVLGPFLNIFSFAMVRNTVYIIFLSKIIIISHS